MSEKKSDSKTRTRDHHTRLKQAPNMTKRCPFCSTILALNEMECHSCKKKVGEVDKGGKAKVPGRWKTYVSAGIAIGILFYWLVYGRSIVNWAKGFFGMG